MARRTAKVHIFPAPGGLQSANNPALIDPKNLKTANNIIFTNDASRKSRPPLKTFALSGITSTSDFKLIKDFWRLSAGGSQSNRVVAVAGGKVFIDGGGDGVFTDITSSFTVPATDNITADVFAGTLVMAFQNISPMKVTNTNILDNLGGSPPQASLYRTHRRIGWLAGIPSTPHRLHRSAVGDVETWTGGSTETFNVDEGDGDPEGITALFPSFYGDLYVAKRRSLYRVRLNSSGVFAIDLVLRGVGCISQNSVVALQNDIIFCSERGVHSLSSTQKFGDAITAFLSAPIHDIYNEQLDFSRAKQMQATYIPELNSYMLSFPRKGFTSNKDLLGFNIVTGQWFRWQSFDCPAISEFVDSSNKTRMIIGQSDGKVNLLDQASISVKDFGTTFFSTSFSTGVIYPTGADKISRFKFLTVIYRPQGASTFTVAVRIDGEITGTLSFSQEGKTGDALGSKFILGVSKLGNLGEVKIVTLPIKGVGRGIELSFLRDPSSDNMDNGMEILGYIIEVLPGDESELPSIQ